MKAGKETVRWILTALAVGAAFIVGLYVRLALVFSPFPKELTDPVAGFLLSLLVVCVGAWVAPRQRVAVGCVLGAGMLCLGIASLWLHSWGTGAGAVIAAALVAWWFRSGRTRRSTIAVGVVGAVAFCAFLVVVFLRYTDRPARPDALPPVLEQALGVQASRVSAFYSYDLGRFIDSAMLWRIDAEADVIASVVQALELQSVNSPPGEFWRMPPYYWPRSLPAGGAVFQTPGFPQEGRGPDGAFYVLVHDKAHGRAYVWEQINF